MDKAVKDAFRTVEYSHVEILSKNVWFLLFFGFYHLFCVFFWNFDCGKENLSKCDKSDEQDNKHKAKIKCEGQVDLVDKLEGKEYPKLATDLKSQKDEIGANETEQDAFEGAGILEVLNESLEECFWGRRSSLCMRLLGFWW